MDLSLGHTHFLSHIKCRTVGAFPARSRRLELDECLRRSRGQVGPTVGDERR